MDDDTVTAAQGDVTADGTGVQDALPFDADADRPIPYALTARARRVVAPGSLPALRIVGPDDGPALDEVSDTRPARARALRRAGRPIAEIAERLDVDDLLVRAWVGDVPGPVAVPSPGETARPAEQEPEAFVTARDEAASGPVGAIAAAPGSAAVLGLVVGLAELTPHAATLVVHDPAIGRAALTWLRSVTSLEAGRLTVVLRVADGVAADEARHAWTEALGVRPSQVRVARWRGAPTRDAVEALVRIADPTVAGRLTGWRERLLGSVTTTETGGF